VLLGGRAVLRVRGDLRLVGRRALLGDGAASLGRVCGGVGLCAIRSVLDGCDWFGGLSGPAVPVFDVAVAVSLLVGELVEAAEDELLDGFLDFQYSV
jgi:hypothetical protein